MMDARASTGLDYVTDIGCREPDWRPLQVLHSGPVREPGASAPRLGCHTMTMAFVRPALDTAVSCSCLPRGDYIGTRPVLPAAAAYRLWLEHAEQAEAGVPA